MKVVVQNLTGTLFYVQVDNDATVEDLKREIEAQQKLPRDRLILVLAAVYDGNDSNLSAEYNNRVLTKEEEKMSVVDCGVQDGSHIYLFMNPPEDDDPFGFTLPYILIGHPFPPQN